MLTKNKSLIFLLYNYNFFPYLTTSLYLDLLILDQINYKSFKEVFLYLKKKNNIAHKKFFFFKKSLSINFFCYYQKNLLKNKKNPHTFSIEQRVPITKKIFNKILVDFYYNFKKKIYWKECDVVFNQNTLQHKSIFMNCNKPLVHLFTLVRRVQWKFQTFKTLKERRYKIFFKKNLKNQMKLTNLQLKEIVYGFNRLKNYCFKDLLFETSNIKNYNFYLIIQSPIILLRKVWDLYFFNKHFNCLSKISRWSYLNFKTFIYPWMSKKRKINKQIKRLSPLLFNKNHFYLYDRFTNTLFLNKKFLFKKKYIEEFLNYPAIIKLYKFRYNI